MSDTFWNAHKDVLLASDPGLTPVLYVGEDPVDPSLLNDVEVAVFSGDVWPDRSRGLMISILKSPNLKWLHTFSTGVDNPAFQSLADRGVRITTSAGSSASPIAQTVMMYMLALSRHLPLVQQQQRDKVWKQQRFDELDGSSVAVIGMGPIGQEVVRLAMAFNMNVTACRRTPSGDEPCPTRPLSELRDVVAANRWVVLALPLTNDTRLIFGEKEFAAMQQNSYFINVGRGELVNEPALIKHLQSGHLAGAGLDVFTSEPLEDESPLWSMSNVIVTPHSSGSSNSTADRAAAIFIENFPRYINDEPLRNEFRR